MRENTILMVKPTDKLPGDHQVIRHAYENVLTACARLAAFATGTPTGSLQGLINERQSILCHPTI